MQIPVITEIKSGATHFIQWVDSETKKIVAHEHVVLADIHKMFATLESWVKLNPLTPAPAPAPAPSPYTFPPVPAAAPAPIITGPVDGNS
jgi:hypothetical protein